MTKKQKLNEPLGLLQRILNKVKIEKDSGCWVWTGSKSNNRFGTIKHNKKTWKASRLTYTLFRGEIKEGMYLLHSCDNELCINPLHLREGTQKENMKDMYERGRGRKNPLKGSSHPSSKVTEADVLKIRSEGLAQKEIGERYGLSQQTVSEIIQRKTWKHI